MLIRNKSPAQNIHITKLNIVNKTSVWPIMSNKEKLSNRTTFIAQQSKGNEIGFCTHFSKGSLKFLNVSLKGCCICFEKFVNNLLLLINDIA